MKNTFNAGRPAAPPPAGPVQLDGNVSAIPPAPTRAPLQPRESSPMKGRSSMEQAMGALADKLHKPRR